METRKLFQADDKFWMELFNHELVLFKDQPELIRWFTVQESVSVPTSEVQVVKKEK